MPPSLSLPEPLETYGFVNELLENQTPLKVDRLKVNEFKPTGQSAYYP